MKTAGIKNKLRALILTFLALPIVFFVRLLRPFLKFRFGIVKTTRIGHFAVETELYLCERELGMHGRKTFDFFTATVPVVNKQLLTMFKREMYISLFVHYLYKVNLWFPGSDKYIIKRREDVDKDYDNLLTKTGVHLVFTPEEEKFGINELKKMGISKTDEFICFHARDNEFLKSMYSITTLGHDHRNSSINNYIQMAQKMTQLGYYAVRMGAITEEPLNISNERIIDYSSKYRTEFLDVYISNKSKFFVVSATGMNALPIIFRKPIVFVNISPIRHMFYWYHKGLFIFKRLWHRKESRYLNFKEMLVPNVFFNEPENINIEYETKNIEVIDNTPEEICDLAIEMDQRLKGKWQSSKEDEELQEVFWDLFKSIDIRGEIKARIGASFLRQNKNLLH